MSDLTLSRRAVACPGFRLMSGMLTTDGERIVRAHPNPAVFNVRAVLPDGSPGSLRSPILPDLTDPATIGALLALYDERRTIKTCPDPVYTAAAVYGLMSRETVVALVAALEAP